MSLHLAPPSEALLPSYLTMLEEMRAEGETLWEDWTPRATETPSAFILRLHQTAHTAPAGFVPYTTYWAVVEERDGKKTLPPEVVGRIALRHSLTPELREFGGNVGYEVRPSARRKGHATRMLRELLQTPEARQIGRLLLTCDPDNVASNRTILANGGALEKTVFVERVQRMTQYYWITPSG